MHVRAFNEAFGLRELRAKINAKAGITKDDLTCRYSIWSEECYGDRAVEITRKWLDSGILQQHTKKEFSLDKCWTAPLVTHRYYILLGCVMSLGTSPSPSVAS